MSPLKWLETTLCINPEYCWLLTMSLGHTLWQAVAILLIAFAVQRLSVSVHWRFAILFSLLLLVGTLPVVNALWYVRSAERPVAIQAATEEYQRTGHLQLLSIAELTANSPSNRAMNGRTNHVSGWSSDNANPLVPEQTHDRGTPSDPSSKRTTIARLQAPISPSQPSQVADRTLLSSPPTAATNEGLVEKTSVTMVLGASSEEHARVSANAESTLVASQPSAPMHSADFKPDTSISAINLPIVIVVGTTLAYLLGLWLMLLRLGVGFYSQWRFARRFKHWQVSITVPDSIQRLAQAAAVKYGRRLSSRISLYSGHGTAIVVGCLRPTILLNVSLVSGLTPQQLEQIIAHELAHVYRYDHLTLVLQRLVESVLFFHPVVWYLSRELSDLRELCCDDWVVHLHEPAEYANTLLD